MLPKLERASFITISKDFLAIADTCGNATFVLGSRIIRAIFILDSTAGEPPSFAVKGRRTNLAVAAGTISYAAAAREGQSWSLAAAGGPSQSWTAAARGPSSSWPAAEGPSSSGTAAEWPFFLDC